ncbi:MAG: VOC family protein [Solirubrobacteraceae bacterium]
MPERRPNGGEIESGPKEYYAVFLDDPDGIKLEIIHRPVERDLVTAVQELTARVAELESRLR